MFNQKSDWLKELERCQSKGWRVISCSNNTMNNSLPQHYVIPKVFERDDDYFDLAQKFHDHRAAIWVNIFV